MFVLLDFDRNAIEKAIQAAELRTTGEIMVYLDQRRCEDALERAKEVFAAKGMTNTRERNGILLYTQLRQRDFVVLADEGIFSKVEPAVWQTRCDRVLRCVREKEMTVGILLGVMMAAEQLACHFPGDGTPRDNQLPNCTVEVD
ncbi:MAG: TPM domain-containing protein [Planctomycetes bacterium]|nr:TPM domain-containing protein [Planctomycetota bacterium]